jgi:beta-glucosidase
MKRSTFPPDFLWGVATSAYQIEGAVSEDSRGVSIWDTFAAMPGKTFQGQSGAVAADHYHRMESDVALMAELGLRSYRFSIAWPRVIPDGTGPVNVRGLDFYDRLVDTLLDHGIEPMVTLYHWDLPLPLHQLGGWLRRETATDFADYAEIVARRLGDRVTWWITQNEPWCAAYMGYGSGEHAPGMTSRSAAVIAAHHILLSHGLAMPRMRAVLQPDARIGISLNLYPVYPADDRPETAAAVEQADIFKNRWFLDPVLHGAYPEELFRWWNVASPPIEPGDLALISQPGDFLGINYYERWVVRSSAQGFALVTNIPNSEYTSMGWEIYPEGLSSVLRRVHRDYAPPQIIVTENGAAFHDAWDGKTAEVRDPQRQSYLERHIGALEQALANNVPVQGYFAWSFLDNFEWAEGYRHRFGLVYVDYETQRRIVKSSGRWYADFIRAASGSS